MGEKEDKEKAEKLAAAKKRVAQLQKKKKAGEKSGGKTKDKSAKDDGPKSPVKDAADAEPDEKEEPTETEEKQSEDPKPVEDEPADADEADFNAAIAAATSPPADDTAALKSPEDDTFPTDTTSKPHRPGRQASISLQSKLRSTSFRDTAAGLVSPSASSFQRVEELERENKRLADEASEHESRWRRTEEQLEELREEQVAGESKTIEALKSEIDILKRQQRTGSTSGGGKSSRRESTANMLSPAEDASHLKDLEAKDATIADMQLEISRLRSQLSSQTEGCETHGEQISSLQSSLSATETKARHLETELSDAKKALNRASEKAVHDGTERTSKDTRIRELERQLTDSASKADEATKKADTLEKKVDAMNKLHREAESRAATKLSAAEAASREIPALRAKVATQDAENARLREKHKRMMSGGGADEGIDEMEDEERQKLERRIRELEGEVFDLQRGVWRDKRTAMQPGLAGGEHPPNRASLEGRATTEEGFDEVDLSGAAMRAGSTASPATQQQQQKHSNFSQYLSSGFNAFMGPQQGQAGSSAGRPRNDSLLQDFEGDDAFGDGAGFDEAAFAAAQREEEMKKMVEHVREVKRGLAAWKGWRLDLVESRRAEGAFGLGVGEVFEV